MSPKSTVHSPKSGFSLSLALVHRPALSFHVSRFTTQHATRVVSPLRTPRSALRTGFTLVEILIAIGILGMVLVSIFSTWTAILRATRAGQEAAATVQRARMTAQVLEDSLSSVQFFTANVRYYSFDIVNGDEPSLSFVARLSPSFPRSGKFGDLNVRRLTFSVEPAADSSRELVLRQAPVLFTGPDGVQQLDVDEKEHPIVLAKNVKEFSTQVWDPRDGWVDEWTTTNQLPPLVKVNLQLLDKPGSMAPPEQITRIVSIPTLGVQPIWQAPRGFPSGPGGQPTLAPPGANPPGANPNQQMPGFQMPGAARAQ